MHYHKFKRGVTIPFRHEFFDSEGNPFLPSAATLRINYPDADAEDGRTVATPTVVVTGNIGTATWESNVSDKGQVHWWLYTSASPVAVDGGVITLEENLATPEPV